MELIHKTPGVCGGRACIGGRRLPVWQFVEAWNLGRSTTELKREYDPPLGQDEVDAAWIYAQLHLDEIAADIRDNNLFD